MDFDSLYDALADSHRRFIITCLDDHPGSLTLRDLAIRLAAQEHDVPVADVPTDAFEPTYVQVFHAHIPKLVEANIVTFDPDRARVTLAAGSDEARASVILAQLDQ